jgi:hypothetical protein
MDEAADSTACRLDGHLGDRGMTVHAVAEADRAVPDGLRWLAAPAVLITLNVRGG